MAALEFRSDCLAESRELNAHTQAYANLLPYNGARQAETIKVKFANHPQQAKTLISQSQSLPREGTSIFRCEAGKRNPLEATSVFGHDAVSKVIRT